MSYEERMQELKELQYGLEELERKIEMRKEKILEEREKLEKERVEKSDKLSEDEEKGLRNQLKVLVELLGNKNTRFANLKIVDEEPDTESESGYMNKMIVGKYSFNMDIALIEEYGGPGFRINVVLKTKIPHVIAIVREMVDIDGPKDPNDEVITRMYWSADWDYHQNFVLKDNSV